MFRELLIVVIPAHVIGMTFDVQSQSRVPRDDAGHFRQLLPSCRLKRELGRIEQDIRHVHDQASGRVTSLENGVELDQQPCSQLRLLRLQPFLLFPNAVQIGLGSNPLGVILSS